MAQHSPRESKTSKSTESEQNLMVALRVRPISADEIIQGAKSIAYAINKKIVVLMDPLEDPDDVLRANRSREKSYAFDYAFEGSASQQEVYEQTAKFLIPSVIQGYNATVFAYGATGAGKTYTMLGTDDEPGIMALSLNDLFQEMHSTDDEMAYRVSMSYLEIYNEMIRDLLNPSSGVLDLREDAKGVQVSGLSQVYANCTDEVMAILKRGNLQRTCEPTAANRTSSRSHAVLQITINQRQRVRSVKQEVRKGCLFLIDLAGSERAAATQNTGKRMVEGAHINRSLLALGNCINALCDKHGAKYVNYRDSKLTRLLKDALGGNCRTVMIAHVSPASNQFEESRNTLVYADRAKNIKTKPRRNTMDVSYHIVQYTNIITELRDEVIRLRVRLDTANKKSISGELHRGGKLELDKLKDQLLDAFREQMDIRRYLMELNNTSIDVDIDYTRNNLIIKKWEREKALRPRHANHAITGVEEEDQDSKTFLTEAKSRDLRGEASPEPSDVTAARDELTTLSDERQKTENLKTSTMKALVTAKEKTAKIEELLPRVITHTEQQEVLSLLYKVHELEIRNMEMQAACLVENYQIRKKDLILLTYEQHLHLCDDVIAQQRKLLDEQQVPVNKELEELYELFQQESCELSMEDNNLSLPDIWDTTMNGTVSNQSRKFLEIDSVSDMTSLGSFPRNSENNIRKTVTRPHIQLPRDVVRVNSVAAKRVQNKRGSLTSKQRVKEEHKPLFSRSPRAKEIMREKALAKVPTTNKSSPSLNSVENQPIVTRQQSIITLSNHSHSATTSPTHGNDNESVNIVVATYNDVEDEILLRHPERRNQMTTGTRNIVALAHAKRSKQNIDVINTRQKFGLNNNKRNDGNRTFVNHTRNRTNSENLTQSRLAQHTNSLRGDQQLVTSDSDNEQSSHKINLPPHAIRNLIHQNRRSI